MGAWVRQRRAPGTLLLRQTRLIFNQTDRGSVLGADPEVQSSVVWHQRERGLMKNTHHCGYLCVHFSISAYLLVPLIKQECWRLLDMQSVSSALLAFV